jgi:hypothetical protein
MRCGETSHGFLNLRTLRRVRMTEQDLRSIFCLLQLWMSFAAHLLVYVSPFCKCG